MPAMAESAAVATLADRLKASWHPFSCPKHRRTDVTVRHDAIADELIRGIRLAGGQTSKTAKNLNENDAKRTRYRSVSRSAHDPARRHRPQPDGRKPTRTESVAACGQ